MSDRSPRTDLGVLREWMNVARDVDGFEYCCPTALQGGLTYEVLKALIEEVEAAKAYLDAADDDPDLAEKFQRWLRAQAVFA